ncbi:uncharacterized protein LOC112220398 [Oncorhynchus tshawytscha]|uniref:uncharacterized protein LOC112220398 n=1 Tax=Oncorhynchus tshawytscha TaxID=74940 RepID=UPI001C3C3213|nr:uncharacterized protein LOC112220398 [Oncorhynchus tshawytscha]
MLINEAFQRQLSTIVEVLVATAVAEMGRLLDECSAFVMPLKLVQQNEESILLKSRLQRVNKTKTETVFISTTTALTLSLRVPTKSRMTITPRPHLPQRHKMTRETQSQTQAGMEKMPSVEGNLLEMWYCSLNLIIKRKFTLIPSSHLHQTQRNKTASPQTWSQTQAGLEKLSRMVVLQMQTKIQMQVMPPEQ